LDDEDGNGGCVGQGCEGGCSPDGRVDTRGREAVGMATLIDEAARAVVVGVQVWPLQHGGRVGGEVSVYSRWNSVRGRLTVRGAVGGPFMHFPANNDGLQQHEEDKRQGGVLGRPWCALVAKISRGDGRGRWWISRWLEPKWGEQREGLGA
jgi:hypothetical protein